MLKSKGDKIWYILDAPAIWQREGTSEIMVCALCDCKITIKALYHCALTHAALLSYCHHALCVSDIVMYMSDAALG